MRWITRCSGGQQGEDTSASFHHLFPPSISLWHPFSPLASLIHPPTFSTSHLHTSLYPFFSHFLFAASAWSNHSPPKMINHFIDFIVPFPLFQPYAFCISCLLMAMTMWWVWFLHINIYIAYVARCCTGTDTDHEHFLVVQHKSRSKQHEATSDTPKWQSVNEQQVSAFQYPSTTHKIHMLNIRRQQLA